MKWWGWAIATALLVKAPDAWAGDEPVHVVVETPATCSSEEHLREAVEALGGSYRAPRANEAARAFLIRIDRDGSDFVGSLAVETAAGLPKDVRTTRGSTCEEVAGAVALFVALALDDPAEVTPTPTPTPGFLWPLAAAADVPVRKAGRRGSGGVALTYSYQGDRGGPSEGIRAIAVKRVDRTRVGGLVAVSEGEHRLYDRSDFTGRTSSARVAATLGWGAPWNDVVVGFQMEGGVVAGKDVGLSRRRVPAGTGFSTFCAYSEPCFDVGAPAPASRTWASPQFGLTLVLQVPWKFPVRPIASYSTTVQPLRAAALVAIAGDVGLVWQAW